MNKDHWYDGWFYDFFIAPNQDTMFKVIIDLLEPNSNIIDIGCGTGRFAFSVANKCKSVVGIDLSKKNIEKANLILSKKPNDKISFLHKSVSQLISEKNIFFNYAILTYVIHEVNEEDRIKLLKYISQLAEIIIIGDYLVPKPKGVWSLVNEIVEFAAGSNHYKNYKNYVNNGGIVHLANEAGLKISKEIKNKPQSSHIVVLKKN